MNLENKLQRFMEVVRTEAEDHKQKMLQELDDKFKKSCDEFEKKAVEKYVALEQDALLTAEKAKQKKISETQSSIRKELIKRRSGYSEQIFLNVGKRLNEFFKTTEYKQMIIDSIKDQVGDVDTTTMVAYIMERDASFKSDIEKETDIKVEVVSEDFLGGVRILLGKNRIADCTMKNNFDSEKASFNKIKII